MKIRHNISHMFVYSIINKTLFGQLVRNVCRPHIKSIKSSILGLHTLDEMNANHIFLKQFIQSKYC